eukprot:CAMPEP_0170604872 /NCGR_PEP_ID=MMETSP0224-20130122/19668_1 /TAXON_ID=285029 /ORGANISM="Togula jolla, Strain CCCM 725" /LENGTH=814 /DNA_ID=CAMNT_0010929831 /DNA_START=103 /DNA_END=2547 /DNA_ORIENTATION=-
MTLGPTLAVTAFLILLSSEVKVVAGLQGADHFRPSAPSDDGKRQGLLQLTAQVSKADGSQDLVEEIASVEGLVNQASRADQPSSGSVVVNSMKKRTAADLTGVTENAVGDLVIFLTGLFVSSLLLTVFVGLFSVLRRRWPMVYGNNVLRGTAPLPGPGDTFLGWIRVSWNLHINDIIQSQGLDAAMLLEFCNLMMKILGYMAVPLVFMLGPLHWRHGGNRSGLDNLSKWGMANVVDGSPLYYLHAVVVWLTVAVVQLLLYRAQVRFLRRRKLWLMSLPAPRATTILVENIPPVHGSDTKLKDYFERIFGKGSVSSSFVVKHTENLCDLIAIRDSHQAKKDLAAYQLSSTGVRPMCLGVKGRQDVLKWYDERLVLLEDQITSEKKRINKEAKEEEEALVAQRGEVDSDSDGFSVPELDFQTRLHTSNGFVTFKNRKDSEMALCSLISANKEEFVVSMPPDPADVIYADLKANPLKQNFKLLLGYLCIVGLFLSFMPFVVGISTTAKLENLEAKIPVIRMLMKEYPAIHALWDALMASAALGFFMSFLPTFLVMIFYSFFVLKAEAWLQHRLQKWYFCFLMIFVLLVTAVGSSLTMTASQIAQHPLMAPSLLADTMPLASHFYLNYIPMQWVAHGMDLVRYVILMKFMAFRTIMEEEVARAKSEPEDQDFYGMGSRSARFTLEAVVCIVFSTLSPLITVLGFLNFVIRRIVFGYLIAFAESRKPDLGGAFWVSKLHHVQVGMYFYIMLMTGVLLKRAAQPWPGCMAAASLAILTIGHSKFRSLKWEDLPLEATADPQARSPKENDAIPPYRQPELR